VVLILELAKLIDHSAQSERAANESLAEAGEQEFLGLTHDKGKVAR
jgi:hypothetical protein